MCNIAAVTGYHTTFCFQDVDKIFNMKAKTGFRENKKSK
jgi:hypothetical protein